MKWLQHSIVQIDSVGVSCRFITRSAGSQAEVLGWIMPDGMGVFQDQGVMVEFEPESIITDDLKALRLARQGAVERHLARFLHDYTLSDSGSWKASGDKWVRQSRACIADVMGVLTIHVTFKAGAAELLRFYTEFNAPSPSFRANLRAPQQAGKASAEQYLFGEQPAASECTLGFRF